MSILIKGVKMPPCCDECWAMDDYGDYPRCRITGEQHGYTFGYAEYRMPDCPLIPVKPHGRWARVGRIETWAVSACSACGHQTVDNGAYCPNCGARMDEEGEEK